MGFFSKKKSKKKAAATKSTGSSSKTPAKATPSKEPTTPAAGSEPVTPPTVEAKTPSTVEQEPVAVTPTKKKHKTRISVTTPEREEEEPNTPGQVSEDSELSDDSEDAIEVREEAETGEGASNQSKDATNEGESTEDPVTVDGEKSTTDAKAPLEFKTENDENVNKNLLGTFDTCDIFPDSLKAMLPESWQQKSKSVPEDEEAKKQEAPQKKMSYYSEEFAIQFLESNQNLLLQTQELTAAGFALVYHQPSLTIEEERADWQGRSVTMNFKPGVCNALEVVQPSIEWTTMGGGKDKKVMTQSVDLVDIHSIAVSSIDDMRDDLEAGEVEEIQCFFTLTTKSGDVHVFESLNKDESNRIVLGIKNIAGRYSNLTIAGDPRVIVEFFDNSANAQEIVLPFDRAIVQMLACVAVAGDPRVIVECCDNSANAQEIVLPLDRAIVQTLFCAYPKLLFFYLLCSIKSSLHRSNKIGTNLILNYLAVVVIIYVGFATSTLSYSLSSVSHPPIVELLMASSASMIPIMISPTSQFVVPPCNTAAETETERNKQTVSYAWKYSVMERSTTIPMMTQPGKTNAATWIALPTVTPTQRSISLRYANMTALTCSAMLEKNGTIIIEVNTSLIPKRYQE
eukprot:scaffold333_cov133-Cylindrotheca_fusiformis.AAC.52